MKYLLDTHLIIWLLDDEHHLPVRCRELFSDANSTFFFSLASMWEIAIKSGLGRLEGRPTEISQVLIRDGFLRLGIDERHLDRVAELPMHHRDPFDRMLIAQAEVEPLRLITVDRQLEAYGASVLLLYQGRNDGSEASTPYNGGCHSGLDQNS